MNAPYESVEPSQRGPSDRRPGEIEQEAEAIREDLELTLSSLERKLSPRELLDRSLDYVQENGGDLLQKIGASVSKNPLPLLVTSAGLIWLFASSRASASSRSSGRSSSAPHTGDFDPLSQSFRSGEGKADRIKQRTRQTLDAARSRASSTWDTTRERAHQYSDSVNGFVTEQPLACGAIAVAAGALIGAAFPSTSYERDMVARAKDSAGKMMSENGSGDAQSRSASPLSH